MNRIFFRVTFFWKYRIDLTIFPNSEIHIHLIEAVVCLIFSQGDIDGDGNRKSMEEIKKLQEELSALRQENIQLKVRTVSK